MRRIMRFAAAALALLTGFLAGPAARAQQADSESALEESMYQDALRAIAEGRRNDASAELRRLIERAPRHVGAWIDLGLTQCALGHGDEAERMFAIIETSFNPGPALLQLIAETREAGCNDWRPQSSFTLTTGRGIDQNVNQGASTASYALDTSSGPIEYALSSDFLPHHDQYTMLALDGTRELTRNGSVGFAQFLGRRNDHLHRYDSNLLFTGVDTPWRFGEWSLHSVVSLGAVTLGNHDYEHQAQLQARVTPPLPLPAGTQFSVLAGVTRNAFQTLQNFDSTTYELRGLLNYRRGSQSASATIGYLADRASGLRPGGARDGWYGNLLVRKAFSNQLDEELAYTVQSWQGQSPYSPGLIDAVRRQLTQSLRGTLSYRLSEHHTLQLEARVVRNRENISVFQYNNRQLQLTWQWQY